MNEPGVASWLDPVRCHYEGRFEQHGLTARGVDWRDEDSQQLRFCQLDALCLTRPVESVCDLGCGYGAYLSHLRGANFTGEYIGIDASDVLAAAAVDLHKRDPKATVFAGDAPMPADAIVASGTFNVALDAQRSEWEAYVWSEIRNMWRCSRLGIAFNLLSMLSDPERRSSDLFYAQPHDMLRRVQMELTPHAELRHAYGLFEFTIIAVRDPIGRS